MRKLGLAFMVLLLLGGATASPPKSWATGTQSTAASEQPIPSAEIQKLIIALAEAGPDAHIIWTDLTKDEQAAIKQVLIPDLVASKTPVDLAEVRTVPSSARELPLTHAPEPQSWWNYNYIANKRYCCNMWRTETSAGAWGPGVLTLSTQRTVSNTWSGNASIGAGTVSAEVGFSVNSSHAETYSYQVNVPAGKFWRIYASNRYERTKFEIWNYNWGNRIFLDNGWADKFVGIDYWIWQS